MSPDELLHSIDLLEYASKTGSIPAPSADRLIAFLFSEISRQETSRQARDQILRENQFTIDARSTWERASVISNQARRLHCGMRSGYSWITRADRVKPLPETQRQIFRILTSR